MTPTEKNEGYRTADEMADRQREISVSKFFLKNRLIGDVALTYFGQPFE